MSTTALEEDIAREGAVGLRLRGAGGQLGRREVAREAHDVLRLGGRQ